MNKEKQKKSGFTLIELMIVVAIVGLLAAIAIPRYQDFVARAHLAELIVVTDHIADRALEYYNIHGHWPAGNIEEAMEELGLGHPSDWENDLISSAEFWGQHGHNEGKTRLHVKEGVFGEPGVFRHVYEMRNGKMVGTHCWSTYGTSEHIARLSRLMVLCP